MKGLLHERGQWLGQESSSEVVSHSYTGIYFKGRNCYTMIDSTWGLKGRMKLSITWRKI